MRSAVGIPSFPRKRWPKAKGGEDVKALSPWKLCSVKIRSITPFTASGISFVWRTFTSSSSMTTAYDCSSFEPPPRSPQTESNTMKFLMKLLGIQTDMQKAAAGRRWAISELAAGKDPDDLLDQVGSGLTFDGPNPFDNEAREAILECGDLFAYARKSKSYAS